MRPSHLEELETANIDQVDPRVKAVVVQLLPALAVIGLMHALTSIILKKRDYRLRRDSSGHERYKPLTYPQKRRKGYL